MKKAIHDSNTQQAQIAQADETVNDTAQNIKSLQQSLRMTWLTWLGYRLVVLPMLISHFNPQSPNMLAGMVWQGLWLIPAFVLTYWIYQGKSPYALLVGSMFTLIYLGASGVVLFMRIFETGWSLWWVYGIDMVLLFVVNILLFILLKRLPSMNKSK